MAALTDRLTLLGVTGFITEDETDVSEFLAESRKYWDYVDEKFLASVRGVCRVKFYLEASDAGRAELARLMEALPDCAPEVRTVRDEDWENNWKQYYKPLRVGKKLLIVPEWEETPETEGRAVLRLDPGLNFGTGKHATTQLCLEALEETVRPGVQMLDLGCGSGILAIAALLFGAAEAVGCDIDDKAPETVMANAALNGFGSDRISVLCGDVLGEGPIRRALAGRRFAVVTANIVADAVIALAPAAREYLLPGGVFIASGIIDGRQNGVRAALEAAGFPGPELRSRDGWNAFVCRT